MIDVTSWISRAFCAVCDRPCMIDTRDATAAPSHAISHHSHENPVSPEWRLYKPTYISANMGIGTRLA